jgi:apolipoprotein D and lipocalin family protein
VSMKRPAATGLALLALILSAVPMASAQAVTALPQLDLTHITGAWYEIARLPNKRQKNCVSDAFIEIALADKSHRFQLVDSCRLKTGDMDANNASGKQDKPGTGKLKATFLWPFYQKYWVLALAPDQSWAIVGSPNHKTLWLLSKTTTLPPDTLADLKSQAAAQGYPIAKLVPVLQTHRNAAQISR